jgi:hypothetical protein
MTYVISFQVCDVEIVPPKRPRTQHSIRCRENAVMMIEKRPFTCSFCKMAYESQEKLESHQALHWLFDCNILFGH